MPNLSNVSEVQTGNKKPELIIHKTSDYPKDIFEVEVNYFLDWIERHQDRNLTPIIKKLQINIAESK